MILLLGSLNYESIIHLAHHLEKIGQDYWVLDSRRLFKDFSVSYCPNTDDGVLSNEHKNIALSDFSSAFWGQIYPPEIPQEQHIFPIEMENADFDHLLYQQELNCTLQTLLSFSKIHWCNSWQAFQMHKTKPLQLSKAKELGALIPKTQVGNSPQVNQAEPNLQQKYIVKPVHAGYMTQAFTYQSAACGSGQSITHTRTSIPFTFQNRITGKNIRTYVIGDEVYSGYIETGLLDFRTQSAQQQIVHRIQLSEQEESLAKNIRTGLGMQWTAIDWIRGKNGKLFFLEANPAPMFVGFEKLTSYPLTKALLKLLCTEP